MSVLQITRNRVIKHPFVLYKRQSIINIFIFISLQLSIWHGGIAEIISLPMLQLWNPLQIFSTVLIITIYFFSKRIPNKVSCILISMKILVSITSVLNMYTVDLVEICRYISLILAIDYFYKEFDQVIKIFMLIYEFLVYYNLYDLLNTQKDIYGVFYSALGYDNDFTKYMLVAYFIALLYGLITRKKIRSICLIIGIHITLFYAGVGTGIVSLIVIDILLVIGYISRLKFSVLQTFIIYIIFEILIVFLKIQNMFSYIIVDVLGKDLTFTGRTDVWNRAIEKILDHPILGYGDLDQLTELSVLGDVYCHNGFLELLFRGGIIQLTLFVIVIITVDRLSKKYLDEKTIGICAAVFCGIWMTSLTESIYHFGITMSIPALIYCACRYVRNNTIVK